MAFLPPWHSNTRNEVGPARKVRKIHAVGDFCIIIRADLISSLPLSRSGTRLSEKFQASGKYHQWNASCQRDKIDLSIVEEVEGLDEIFLRPTISGNGMERSPPLNTSPCGWLKEKSMRSWA